MRSVKVQRTCKMYRKQGRNWKGCVNHVAPWKANKPWLKVFNARVPKTKGFFIEFWNAVLRWSSFCSPPTPPTQQPTTCHPLTVSLPSTHRPTFQYRLYRCVCVRLVKKPRLSRCICCKVEQHQPEEYLSQVRLGLKQSQHVLAGGMHFEKILFHVPSSFFF